MPVVRLLGGKAFISAEEESVTPFGAEDDCFAAMASEILAIGGEGRLIRCDSRDSPVERAAGVLSAQ